MKWKRWNILWGEPALKTQHCLPLEEGNFCPFDQITLITIADTDADADNAEKIQQ